MVKSELTIDYQPYYFLEKNKFDFLIFLNYYGVEVLRTSVVLHNKGKRNGIEKLFIYLRISN